MPTLTYAMMYAAGVDAGNRSMRANGRTAWSVEDFNAAAAVEAKLYPYVLAAQWGLPVARVRAMIEQVAA